MARNALANNRNRFDFFNSHVYLVEYAAVITFINTSPTCYVSFQYSIHLQQHEWGWCSACTSRTTKVRPSCDNLPQGLVLGQTPEYQCLWFQFYRASNFYCMAIAAEPSAPSGPPPAADWAAVSITAASETSVTTSAVVASAAIVLAVTNDDDHPCNRHDVNNCLHDGHNDVIVDDGLNSSCSPLVVRPVNHGNWCQCPSSGSMTRITDNRMDDAEEKEQNVPSLMGVEAWC